MPLGYFVWMLMILWVVLGLYSHRVDVRNGDYAPVGFNLLLFAILFAIVWRVFGFVVK